VQIISLKFYRFGVVRHRYCGCRRCHQYDVGSHVTYGVNRDKYNVSLL